MLTHWQARGRGVTRVLVGSQRRGAGPSQVKTRLNATPGLRGKSISIVAQPVTAPHLRDDLAKPRITVQPGG